MTDPQTKVGNNPTPAAIVAEYLGVASEEAAGFTFRVPKDVEGSGSNSSETIYHDELQLVGSVSGEVEGERQCDSYMIIPLNSESKSLSFPFETASESFTNFKRTQCKQSPIAVDMEKYRVALGALKKAGYGNIAEVKLSPIENAKSLALAAQIREADSKSITVGDKVEMKYSYKGEPYTVKGIVEEMHDIPNGERYIMLLLENGKRTEIRQIADRWSFGGVYLESFREIAK